MWLLIVPLIILLVIILSVGTLTAAVFGALGPNWPWLLIGAGVWMFWKEDGRHRRRRGTRHAWEQKAAATTQPKQTMCGFGQMKEPVPITSKKQAAKPEPPKPPELPIDVQVKVEQIRRKAEVLLSYADRFPPLSKDLFIVRETASEYLPRTVNAYLALPTQTATSPVAGDGMTPQQELKAQLDLLDAKLDEIALDLQRQDVDRLLANRRFLEERFGRANEPLTESA
jgi:hypothetical protein